MSSSDIFASRMLELATTLSKSDDFVGRSQHTKMYLEIPACAREGFDKCVLLTLVNYRGPVNILREWAAINHCAMASSKSHRTRYLLVPTDAKANESEFWQKLGNDEFIARRTLLDIQISIKTKKPHPKFINLDCSYEYVGRVIEKMAQCNFTLVYHGVSTYEVCM